LQHRNTNNDLKADADTSWQQ